MQGYRYLSSRHPGDVICVGAQADNGQPCGTTPAGRELDFLAPGENVWSACSAAPNAVKTFSGTSIAAPLVAGVCALVLAYAEKVGKTSSVTESCAVHLYSVQCIAFP